MHDIAILDDVLLAFEAHLAVLLRAVFPLAGDEVRVCDHLGIKPDRLLRRSRITYEDVSDVAIRKQALNIAAGIASIARSMRVSRSGLSKKLQRDTEMRRRLRIVTNSGSSWKTRELYREYEKAAAANEQLVWTSSVGDREEEATELLQRLEEQSRALNNA